MQKEEASKAGFFFSFSIFFSLAFGIPVHHVTVYGGFFLHTFILVLFGCFVLCCLTLEGKCFA